jgi:hypothetical protein
VLIVPSGGGDTEYRIEAAGETIPSTGDHLVVQRNEEGKQQVLKVRQVIHSLRSDGEKSAVDEIFVEAEPLHHMYDFIEWLFDERREAMPSDVISSDAPGTEIPEEGSDKEAPAEVQMCCDGSGRTAEEHRAEAPNHKCCSD